MTKYLHLRIRSVVLHPSNLVWSIAFVLFWVIMWVYVFSGDMAGQAGEPYYRDMVIGYTATMFASLGMVSMGASSVGLVSSIVPSSAAVRYLTKFSRLRPGRLVLEDLLAGLASLLISVTIIVVASIALVRQHFGVLVVPEHPVYLVLLLTLLGLFFYTLARALGYTALALGSAKTIRSLTNMLPLILAFVPYAMMWASAGNLAGYVFPPVGLQALIIFAASGHMPSATGLFSWFTSLYRGESVPPPANPWIVLASTAIWILALFYLSVVLHRSAKAVHPAELA